MRLWLPNEVAHFKETVRNAEFRSPSRLETVERPMPLWEAVEKAKLGRTLSHSGLSFVNHVMYFQALGDGFRRVSTLDVTAEGFVYPQRSELKVACERLTDSTIREYRLEYEEALRNSDCVTGIITLEGKQGRFKGHSTLGPFLVVFENGERQAVDLETLDTARQDGLLEYVYPSSKKLVELYNKLQADLANPYFQYWSQKHGLEFMLRRYNEPSFTLCEMLENRLRQYLLDVELAWDEGILQKLRFNPLYKQLEKRDLTDMGYDPSPLEKCMKGILKEWEEMKLTEMKREQQEHEMQSRR